MSRTTDARVHPEWDSDPSRKPKPENGGFPDAANRRRSLRRMWDLPVYVYAHEPGQEPFHEEVHTLNVNAQGALLLVSMPVREGQHLLLTNTLTQQDLDCRIVRLGVRRTRTVEAAVVFPYANPDFWHLPKDEARRAPA